MKRNDPRQKLGRLIAEENKGSILGAFLDRRGNEWAATGYYMVRAEMYLPHTGFGRGKASTSPRKLLRKTAAEPSWRLRQEPGLFIDQSRFDPPPIIAMRVTAGPAAEGHVWFSDEWVRAIREAAAAAWPTSNFTWHTSGITKPAVLLRNHDRMLVAILMPVRVDKPWKIETVA